MRGSCAERRTEARVSKSASNRGIVDFLDDAGNKASESLDTDRLTGGLVLSGYTAHSVASIYLLSGDTDLAVTFTNAIGLLIVSEDNEFSLRLAGGETLLTDIRKLEVWGHVSTKKVASTSVLLTGNGVTPSKLKVYIIEKPA